MDSKNKFKLIVRPVDTKEQALTTANSLDSEEEAPPILENEQINPLTYVNVDWNSVKESNITPIIAFVNRKSGGLRGNQAIDNLQSCMNTIQICDLNAYKPSEYIKFYNHSEYLPNITMLCCGGDGTIGWIMDEVKQVYNNSDQIMNKPNINYAIVPFGTGNDLFLHILSSINMKSNDKKKMISLISADSLISNPIKILQKYSNINQKSIQLDRWNMNIIPYNKKIKKYYIKNNVIVRKSFSSDHSLSTSSSSRTLRHKRLISFIKRITIPKKLRIITRKFKNNQIKKLKYILNNKINNKTFNNYFGIGIDGQVATTFTYLRQKCPYVFFHPFINKIWYFFVGLYIFLFYSRKKLYNNIEIQCDNELCQIPSSCTGIIITNISSYAGGSKLWTFGNNNDKWSKQSTNDGIIEVVGVTGVYHLGIIKIGLSQSFPIAQGRNIKITTRCSLPMQVDGEPWNQKSCHIDINLQEKVNILIPSIDSDNEKSK